MTEIRKGQAPAVLSRSEFHQRFIESFMDPAFRAEDEAISRVEAIAWDAYEEGRKAPITQKAGAGYADPDYDMSVEWLATKGKIEKAQAEWRKPAEAKALELAGWDYPKHLAGRTYGPGRIPAST